MDEITMENVVAEGEQPSAEERLERLLQSETIRLVDEGKHTPHDLDSAMRNMKRQIEEMKYQHFLDLSELVRLRRQVEFLICHDNPEV